MRARAGSLSALLLGGVLAVVAAAQPWWRAVGTGVDVRFTGTQSTGGLSQALAVVVLVGWVLMLVLRVTGRRVLAALLALAGAGVVVVGVLRQRPSASTVRSEVREVSLLDQFALRSTPWPWAYALAGVLVLAGAVAVVSSARRWPQRTARFERPGADAASVTGPDPLDDPAAAWKALDAGVDPTVAAKPDRVPEEFGAAAAAPDVRYREAGDTMDEIRSGPSRSSVERGHDNGAGGRP